MNYLIPDYLVLYAYQMLGIKIRQWIMSRGKTF
jgi:hypothetical protein